jgi:putative FmdB family regulatory protein
MPTYAYACKNCGHRFDAVQSFAEPTLTECPQCGGELRKEYGSIGVSFNGSGFYRTDSRAGGEKAASGASSSGGDSGSSASKGGDSGSSSASSSTGTPSPAAPAAS